jgi:hypothetical protein
MIHPIRTAWKCCETCEFWKGCRRFTSLGLVAHYSSCIDCNIMAASQRIGVCDSYRRWGELEFPQGEVTQTPFT